MPELFGAPEKLAEAYRKKEIKKQLSEAQKPPQKQATPKPPQFKPANTAKPAKLPRPKPKERTIKVSQRKTGYYFTNQ